MFCWHLRRLSGHCQSGEVAIEERLKSECIDSLPGIKRDIAERLLLYMICFINNSFIRGLRLILRGFRNAFWYVKIRYYIIIWLSAIIIMKPLLCPQKFWSTFVLQYSCSFHNYLIFTYQRAYSNVTESSQD